MAGWSLYDRRNRVHSVVKYFGILSVTLRRTSSDNLFYVRMHPQDCLAMNARLDRYSTLTELWIVYLHVTEHVLWIESGGWCDCSMKLIVTGVHRDLRSPLVACRLVVCLLLESFVDVSFGRPAFYYLSHALSYVPVFFFFLEVIHYFVSSN